MKDGSLLFRFDTCVLALPGRGMIGMGWDGIGLDWVTYRCDEFIW